MEILDEDIYKNIATPLGNESEENIDSANQLSKQL